MSPTPAQRWLHRLPGPLAIMVVTGTAVVCIVAVVHGLSDPDYYWHLTVGRLIAQSRHVPTTDPFSFTYNGQPWTAHEWLGELLIYWLVTAIGPARTMVLFGVAAMAGPAAMAIVARRRGVSLPALAVVIVLATWIVLGYATIRPQILSWALLGGLVALLWSADPGSHSARMPRRLLVLPLVFALWANLHGLWVAGLGTLGVYAVFTLAGRTPLSPVRLRVAGLTVASALACALTPAGLGTLTYPLRYVDPGDWGLDHISEWQSPNFHDPTYWSVLLLVLVVAAASTSRSPGWQRVIAVLGVAGSLLAVRNGPVGLVAAVGVVAVGLDGMVPFPARLRERLAAKDHGVALGRRLVMLELAVGLVAMVALVTPILPAARTTFPSTYPVAGVNRLLADQPQAHVLAEYGWGGYVLSRLYDAGGRVFVDGRNDMYPQRVLDDYSAIRDASAGWPNLVRRYGVNAVLLPPEAALVRGPLAAAGWCTAYRDAVQVLMLRACP